MTRNVPKLRPSWSGRSENECSFMARLLFVCDALVSFVFIKVSGLMASSQRSFVLQNSHAIP